jgi:hypothetical protein
MIYPSDSRYYLLALWCCCYYALVLGSRQYIIAKNIKLASQERLARRKEEAKKQKMF